MAFPSIRSQITSGHGSTETTHTFTYPSSITAGDTLLCFIATDGDNEFDWPGATSPTDGGWQLLYEGSSGTAACLSVGIAIADGVGEESGDLVIDSTSNEEAVARFFCIQTAADPTVVLPAVSGPNASSGGDSTVTFLPCDPRVSVDYQPNHSGSASFGNIQSQQAYAIEITGDGVVSDVDVWMRKASIPADNVLVKIFEDDGGEPSTTQVGGTGTIPGAAVSADIGGAKIRVALASSATLAPATTYWLVVSRSGSIDNKNYYMAYGGNGLAGEVSMVYNSGNWDATTQDMYFVLNEAAAALDFLWFIAAGYDDDDGGMSDVAWPTNYSTNAQYDISDTGSGSGSLDTSYR